MRTPVRSFAILGLAAVATCTETPTVASRMNQGGAVRRVSIGIVPVFSKAASAVFAQRATFPGVNFDHVHVVVTRPPSEAVIDTTIAFTPTSATQTLDLTVPGAPGETFIATLEYTNTGALVYSGQEQVVSHAPDNPALSEVQTVPIKYVGPGANATRLTLSPKTVTLSAPATATFSVTATDATNAVVTNTPIAWSVSDPTVASISAAGVLTTNGKRGVVSVVATSVTSLTDNASVTVTLPPAAIVVVSGGGQTGKAGTALQQPATVRVAASDGVGIAGVKVSFSAPTGGSVGTSSVSTDNSGAASTSMTLGTITGAQNFTASTGTLSVNIPVTATPSDPSVIAVLSGSGQQDTVKKTLAAPFVAKVLDRFGNGVGGITVTWARTAGTGTLAGTTSVTAADGTTSMAYTLGATPGAETVTATAAGIGTPAVFSARAIQSGMTPPTISGLATTLVHVNDTTCAVAVGGNGGSLYSVTFAYTDPDGNVSVAGTPATLTWLFQPGGFTGSAPWPIASSTGNGFSGTVTLAVCHTFGAATAVQTTWTLRDATGLVSNSLTQILQRPPGANSASNPKAASVGSPRAGPPN
jgi:hypothetical protein